MSKQSACASLLGTNQLFNKKSISINGMALMASGAYFGMLIQAKYFSNVSWKGMLSTSWGKSGLRLLIIVLLLAPFGSVYLMVPSDASIALTIVFKTAVPCLLMFTLLFGCANAVFVKAKLVNDVHSGSLPFDKDNKYQ